MIYFQSNDVANAMIEEVAQRSGLPEATCKELFANGWSYNEVLNEQPRWIKQPYPRILDKVRLLSVSLVSEDEALYPEAALKIVVPVDEGDTEGDTISSPREGR